MRNFLNFIFELISIFSRKVQSQYFFIINPGKHFSRGGGLLPDKLHKGSNHLKFQIHFSSEADVFVKDNPRQINKAIGIKEGLIPNKNSVLLGYSTYDDKFELYLFVNHEKGFDHIKIGDFKTKNWLGTFDLGIRDNEYYLSLEDETWTIPRKKLSPVPEQLGLVRSYFGGQLPNPKDNGVIDIRINMR